MECENSGEKNRFLKRVNLKGGLVGGYFNMKIVRCYFVG